MKKIDTDWLRFIVSCAIVGVHTQALKFISSDADFLFSQVISRVFVPLFLMITGYFTLSKCISEKEKLTSAIKKLFSLYLFSIVLYLPLIVKSGYFNDFSLLAFLSDFFCNGMYFHLWYFPATIIGLILSSILVDKLGDRKALIIAIILYFLGSLGDLYYGLLSGVVKSIYDASFSISFFTRNGVFYAPIFLLIGYYASKHKKKNRNTRELALAVFSFLAMIIEELVIHHFSLARHTTMPLFLLPTAYYSFKYITSGHLAKNVRVRKMSTWIYIIHPLVYTGVRVAGNVLGMEILYKHSLLYFTLSLLLSIAAAYVFTLVQEKAQKVCT